MDGNVNGGHRVAVCGKGGSGKTTIAGTLARVLARRGRHVVAIDGDSNPNLAITLGLPQAEAQRIPPLPRDLLVERTDPSGERSYVLREPPDEIIRTYGVRTPDDVMLLLMGRVDHAGAGWMCRTHATVRRMLGELVAGGDDMTVVDMEAGLEHLSRGTTRSSDTMLVVAEPYFKSLETARRAYELAKELGIPHVFVVANKSRGPRDEEAIRTFCECNHLDLLAAVSFDETVVEAELGGAAVLDVNAQTSSVVQIQRLADLIAAL